MTFTIHLGLRLLTRLRLRLSHLNEHKFSNNFKNCVNPLCTFSLEIESTSHFLLHCSHYNNIRSTLLNELKSLYGNILKLSDTSLTNLILYGGLQVNIKHLNFKCSYQAYIKGSFTQRYFENIQNYSIS